MLDGTLSARWRPLNNHYRKTNNEKKNFYIASKEISCVEPIGQGDEMNLMEKALPTRTTKALIHWWWWDDETFHRIQKCLVWSCYQIQQPVYRSVKQNWYAITGSISKTEEIRWRNTFSRYGRVNRGLVYRWIIRHHRVCDDNLDSFLLDIHEHMIKNDSYQWNSGCLGLCDLSYVWPTHASLNAYR